MAGSTAVPLVEVRGESVDVDGRSRTYTLVTPAGLRPGAALVLVFHGSNQTGEKVRKVSGRSFDALAEAGRAVVAYLDGHKGHWNDARTSSDFPARREGIDDVAFTEAVIDAVTGTYGVDRVYAVGYSNGGQLVIRLVHQIPRRIAGAAIIAATQPAPGNFDLPDEPVTPLPVMLIHGTRDPLVPYDGGVASLWGFRPRGLGRSAPETAEYYAARNGITGAPTSTRLPHRPESRRTSVTRTDYRADGKPSVTLFTVEGGGHVIPNPRKAPRIMGRTTRDLVAAEAVAEFFDLSIPARRDDGRAERTEVR